jgi:molecular chaperone DnaJ
MAIRSEWLEQDYYEKLGVAEDAAREEITRAYRKLAREYHPDTHPDDPQAEDKFKEISAAYDVIGDEGRRKEYDEARRLVAAGVGGGNGFGPDGFGPDGFGPFGPGGAGAGGFTTGGFGPGGFTTFRVDGDLRDIEGLEDLLGGLFRTGPVPRPGRDRRSQLRLSFDDAVTGTTAEVRVGTHRIKVRVPAGVNDGQLIRVAGKGHPGQNDGPAGDLLVTVHVASHRLFGRKGKDLTLTVPVTFPEAALGAEISVPTFEGEPVTLKIPAGTPTGRTFRVADRGVPALGGDLLVTVEVSVPRRLSTAERQAVEALAEVSKESPRKDLHL